MSSKVTEEADIHQYTVRSVSMEGMSTEQVSSITNSILRRAVLKFKASHPLRSREKLEVRITDRAKNRAGVVKYTVDVIPSGSVRYQV